MWLIAGGVPETSADPLRPYNTSLVISPEGRFVARYRKLHLFDVELDDNRTWKESQGTMPGDAPIVADVANLKVGLSICYDLRFPELFAWQKAAGAQVLTLPASFTKMTGEAHWMVLLRARAIENQCYLVAAAQEGTHPLGRQTFGHAAVIDPWGGVLAVCTHPGPGLAVADIDVGIIDEVRRKMPLDRHRHGFNH
jgi:predicted amidohydrolase